MYIFSPYPKIHPLETFSSPRLFRLWHMIDSHNIILLRSERDYTNPQSENIDLVFHGTDYIELPDKLDGVELAVPNAAELEYLQGRGVWWAAQDADRYFVLISGERRYYVVAGDLWVHYNTLGPEQHPWFPQTEDDKVPDR